MNRNTNTTARFTAVLAMGLLAGASAFADSRHPRTTATAEPAVVATQEPYAAGDRSGGYGEDSGDDRYDRGRGASQGNAATNGHGRGTAPRATSEPGYGRPSYDRGEGRGRDHGKKQPYYAHGRVSKVKPYGQGYRVWVAGSPHPYYVPQAYWRPGYFNVGMTIRIGGYYNPRGWYDYYGDYECATMPEKRVRGFVEYIDYRGGRMLLDLPNGGELEVEIGRRHDGARPGDFVVVYGNWNRWGRFIAVDVDVIDRDYRW